MTLQDFNLAKNPLENILDYANQNKDKLDLENDVLKIYASDNPMGKEIILQRNTTMVQQ